MARPAARPITFIVPGQSEPAPTRGALDAAGPVRGRIKSSVRIATRRGEGGGVRVTAVPGEDIVLLHIAGGPVLTLHPEHARDLILAQSEVRRPRGAGGADRRPDEVRVPAQLRWRGLEETVPARGAARGFLGDVLLSAIEVVTGPAADTAADFAASGVVRAVDAQVEAGVYGLDPETLPPLKGSGRRMASVPSSPDPVLVLVHGTFSSTSGTFAKLWSEHPDLVHALFRQYGGRVYALDHPTLGETPVANALTLVRALPPGTRLHLLTHSRGGLVGEVLARACAHPAGSHTASGDSLGGELHALGSLVKRRQPQVERIVRVACPARGTLLASRRLDAYLSVFKWTLELAGLPVLPGLVDFLAAVAQRRADPDVIPGLAVQMPDSPLIRWLHEAASPIPGELRVLAGDIQGDSVTSWLKTLLADAFYWTDNDLVVQTRSMYGGAPRRTGASFVLDRGGAVSHFAYFGNPRTADGVVSGLVQDVPQDFRPIGPLSWAGESAAGVRAPRVAADEAAAAARPAVFVLPGILGTHLKADGERVWIGWRLVNGLERLRYSRERADAIQPDEPIGSVYDDLSAFLGETHEVIPFAYDWRVPIEREARRLGQALDAALDARAASGQPVRIVAHSMGGILARALQLECPETWERLMARPGARLLMLGTPNAGSWAPMQVLSGDDSFGNTLALVGAPFQDAEARAIMAGFPGLLQLQAGLLDAALQLSIASTWARLADDDLQRIADRSWWHSLGIQLRAAAWGLPSQAVLDDAVSLRRRLDAQAGSTLLPFRDRILLVVGYAPFTPDGFAVGGEGLVYLEAAGQGDGRVTHHSAMLPGVKAWAVDCDHGSLPRRRGVFPAYLQLLQDGTTELLPAAPAATRAAAAPDVTVRSRPSRTPLTPAPPQTEAEVLAAESRPAAGTPAAPSRPLQLTVINGDLTFIRQPLLLGHYTAARLTGSEAVMNALVGRAMEASLNMGVYPEEPGSHQVFVNTTVPADNPWRTPRPEAVVVVGLGREGTLRAGDLVRSVRQAVIAWAQRAVEARAEAPPVLELAATLIGSGGAGIAVGQSAQLIAQAVREANEQIDRTNDALGTGDGRRRPLPLAGHLFLVELYLDRATEAFRALQMQMAGGPGVYALTGAVQEGTGALPRPLESGYRGADYDFIRAVTEPGPGGGALIAYTIDTRRARSEVRAQAMQGRLLQDLVERASNEHRQDPRVGRTLFQLLVPIEMEPFLSGATEVQLELDRGTAGIPWEMLDGGPGSATDSRPWAVRTKLLRKLRTGTFRAQALDADADASVLVVGEPDCDPRRYPRLAGAREEARAVAAQLAAAAGLGAERVRALIAPDDPSRSGPDAQSVITALLEREWRIVHIAGHGEPPAPEADGGDPRGVVLSNGAFVGPREIRTMRSVPELVFVNCCYLSAREAGDLLTPDAPDGRLQYHRPRFASGVADELIQIGVRCVVAAGWAVEDEPARTFAVRFYQSILRGERFIDAVARAREAAWERGGNTWAAYQCYGDPDWRLRPAVGDAQRPAGARDELAAVASRRGLLLALETLTTRRRYQGFPRETLAERVRQLEGRFAASYGQRGEVAEAFAVAWAAAGNERAAVSWYERALAAADGGASFRAAEQKANIEVRLAWGAVERAGARRDAARRARQAAGKARTAAARQAREAAGAELRAAERELARALRAGRPAIRQATRALDNLTALHTSAERESLYGSAFKRLAMMELAAGRRGPAARAAARMLRHYERAEALATAAGSPDAFYPALNRMAAAIVQSAGAGNAKGLDTDDLARVRAELQRRALEDPDFWSLAGLAELRMYEALANGTLARQLPAILDAYSDLHSRLAVPWMWRSVLDQARFVLTSVAGRTSRTHAAAAASLLERLERWAAG